MRGFLSSCKEVWKLLYLPPGNRGLGDGTSFQIHTEEVGDGEDFGAGGAFTAKTYVAASAIARAATSDADEAFATRGAFVHRLNDEELLTAQTLHEVDEGRSNRLAAAESESSLAAGWPAIGAAAVERQGPVAHGAGPQFELGSVTVRVTHEHAAHAATACVKVGASSRTNRPSWNW